MAKCAICGAPGKACGGPTHIVVPDPMPTVTQGGIMGGLKRYNFTDVGRRGSVPTVLQLSDDDAKRLGLTDKDLVGAKASRSTSGGSTPAAPRARSGGSRSRAKSGKTPANKAAAPSGDKAAAAQDDASGSTGS